MSVGLLEEEHVADASLIDYFLLETFASFEVPVESFVAEDAVVAPKALHSVDSVD